MANKGFAYGLSAAVAKKIESKRDPEAEEKVKNWIETITEERFNPTLSYELNMKNGIILCKLINKIHPKSVKSISKIETPFKQMENISQFLTAIEAYGVKKTDLFQTVDLFQGSNIPAVTATLMALGSVCQQKPDWASKGWPNLGAKIAHENLRTFDEATIAEGKKVIGIQAGTNKLASQAGQNFGGRRQVAD